MVRYMTVYERCAKMKMRDDYRSSRKASYIIITLILPPLPPDTGFKTS